MNCLNIENDQGFVTSHYQNSNLISQYPELNSTPVNSPRGLDYDGCHSDPPSRKHLSIHLESNVQKSRYAGLHNSFSDYDERMTPWAAIRPGVVGQERTQTPLSRNHVASLGHQHQQQAHSRSSTHHHSDYASGHHNTVEVERIRQGLDVRTTVWKFGISRNFRHH